MVEAPQRTFLIPLFVSALAIGAAVSVGERVAFAMALDRGVDWSEPDVIAINALLSSLPFLYLAFRGSARFRSWLIGVALTLAATGWWLLKGIAYQKAPDGSGVDMFGALVMLLAPFAITALVAAVDARSSPR